MTELNWELLQTIFHTASELDSAERESYLDSACEHDAVLRAEVEALLKSPSDDQSLADAVRGEASLLLREKTGPQPGDSVGPYLLVRAIGQGGMGTVFLGVRADREFERQVAIKFVTPGAATESLLARFRVERQILATLDHPNIAHLLDGGVTNENIPYLAMEFVEGVSVETYCSAKQLSVRGRVELFLELCGAVAYAHSRMVVHRDIKPSNILVTAEGKPKLLDFGVARIQTPAGAMQTAEVTRLAERMMTLEYASPEQVRGEPVTAATDIYALGILLYELLSGRHPLPVRDVDFLAAQRMICETVPTRPFAGADGATRFPGLLRAFTRSSTDDLDAVVLMAVRKNAAERYSSVTQFAEDLRRYLDGFPVLAKKGSRRYHAARFIRRHRLGVATAAVFMLVVIGFGTGMAMLAARVTRERDAARLERSRSEQVTAFVQSLFSSSDPYKTGRDNRSLTAKDLLDSGAKRISRDLAQQPRVRASLLDTLGEAYQHLGLLPAAGQMFQQEITAHEQADGKGSPEAAKGLRALADIERMRGDFHSAELDLRRALAIQQKYLRPDDPELVRIYSALGLVMQNESNYEAAEDLFRRAVTIASKYPNETATLVQRSNLASLLMDRARYEDSEVLFREVLERRRRIMGQNHPQVALSMLRLAVLLSREGKYEEAERLDRAALVRYKQLYAADFLDLLLLETNLAAVLHFEGKLVEAESLYRTAIELGKTRYRNHIEAAIWTAGFASLLTEKGDFTQARQILDESLATCLKSLGPDTISEARIRGYSGLLNTWTRQFADAERDFQTALKIRRTRLGAGHPEVAVMLFNLAELRRAEGRNAEARSLYEEALAIDRKAFPNGHLQTTAHALGDALELSREKDPRALEVARDAVQMRIRLLPKDAWQIAEAKSATGEILSRLDRFPEAEKMLLEGYGGLENSLGHATLATQTAVANLADLYERWKRSKSASIPVDVPDYRAKLLPFYKLTAGRR